MTISEANQWWLWGNTVLIAVTQAGQVGYAWWVSQRAKQRERRLKEELAHREMLRLEYQKDIAAGMAQVKEQTNGNIVELKRMVNATIDRLDRNEKLVAEVLKKMEQQKCQANAAAS